MSLVKKKELENFKKKFYQPNNMVIAVSGKFDKRKLIEKITNTFGNLNKGKSIKEIISSIKNKKRYKEEYRKNLSQTYLALGFKVPGFQSEDYPKLKLLSELLSGGMSSIMFRELREKRGIGYSVGSSYDVFGSEGMFFTYIEGLDPKRLKEAKETILKIFDKLKKEKISSHQFSGCKTLMMSKYDDILENISKRAELMLETGLYNIPFDFRKLEKTIKKISKEDIMNTAQKYLDDNYTMTLLRPKLK